MSQAIVVLSNLPDSDSAEALARTLVELRLAACVNILPAVQSVYRWQGKLEHVTECTLLIKTVDNRYQEVQRVIVTAHPYAVPEIISLPITAGLPAYLAWLTNETTEIDESDE
ncbi:MAG: divalent-cation tolerance protein CutA [Herbaspirillum sp.]